MADKSIGFIETFGLAACVAAADAAVKSANVKLLGFEYAKGDGMCTVKVEGNVGACKAAVEAGKRAAEAVQGSLSGTKSVLLKARPAPSMRALLVDNRETVGGEIALAEGYRPAGDSKKPVLVKNWKPKEEPKAETPMEEAPEPPVVEELEDKTSDKKETDSADVQPEEAPEAEETEPEAPQEVEAPAEEAPQTTETQPEEAPEEAETKPEETESVVAPEAEEAPVAAPEEEPKEEPAEEKKAEDVTDTDAPAKKPSTGNRRSVRSRKKKNTDK